MFTIFEQMCLTNFFDEYNLPMNAVKLMVSEVLMFHENTDLIPSVDSNELYMDNNDPTERITVLFFGILVINKISWADVAKEYWARGTNSLSHF